MTSRAFSKERRTNIWHGRCACGGVGLIAVCRTSRPSRKPASVAHRGAKAQKGHGAYCRRCNPTGCPWCTSAATHGQEPVPTRPPRSGDRMVFRRKAGRLRPRLARAERRRQDAKDLAIERRHETLRVLGRNDDDLFSPDVLATLPSLIAEGLAHTYGTLEQAQLTPSGHAALRRLLAETPP